MRRLFFHILFMLIVSTAAGDVQAAVISVSPSQSIQAAINAAAAGVINGDFNNSGIVDGVDYGIWLNNYGT